MTIRVQSETLFERRPIGYIEFRGRRVLGAPCPMCKAFNLVSRRNPCPHYARESKTEMVFIRIE